MRLALGLEYNGSRFCGWQTQPAGCGVQDALEHAIAHIANHPVQTVCAGRTDAGVHARGQVVHFDTAATRPLSAWVRGVNSALPPGVSVLWAHEVSDTFSARYDALARRYRYVMLDRNERPGLWESLVGWWHTPLDVAAMQEAASPLVGEHDFSAFRAAECQAKSPVRHLYELSVQRSAEFVVFDLRANAFLHHMVRNIVGALVYVGAGRQEAHWVAAVLASKDRRQAAPTFSPDGLYLMGVEYSAEFGLPAPRASEALFELI